MEDVLASTPSGAADLALSWACRPEPFNFRAQNELGQAIFYWEGNAGTLFSGVLSEPRLQLQFSPNGMAGAEVQQTLEPTRSWFEAVAFRAADPLAAMVCADAALAGLEDLIKILLPLQHRYSRIRRIQPRGSSANALTQSVHERNSAMQYLWKEFGQDNRMWIPYS